jgi:DHA1 family bicyclomycin/chloramphenicol resistance-like MFS transporter
MSDTNRQAKLTFALLVCGTVLGLAGIDLVLPAIPSLPNSISGSLEGAQFVLATFAAGTAIGLLVFGELGARFDQRGLLIGALMLYAAMSYLAGKADSISELVLIRCFQGFASSAPAVFAPGMIRSMFNKRGAIKAIGLMGSIESLTPALAPVVGAWLLTFTDWRASFFITATLALFLTIMMLFFGGPLLSNRSTRKTELRLKAGYLCLFVNREFMRQGLSNACTLGGLLIFVFGAPTVIVNSMGGDLSTFVIMQLIGISLFIVSANLSHRFVARFGSDRMINVGSFLTAIGGVAIALFSTFGDGDPRWLWLFFAPVNLGLGLRGPPSFYSAVVAAGDNDSRGAALLILFVLTIAAGGTAVVAPFISQGLVPLSTVAAAFMLFSVVILQTVRAAGEADAS